MRTEETLELRWVFSVIRRRWWLILGCAVLALVVASFVTSRKPPTYEATTTLLVAPAEKGDTSEINTLMAGERLALTYVQLLKARSTLESAISRLGLGITPEALAKKINVVPVSDTQLVRVTANDYSPAQAALIANTVAEVFTEYARSLEQDRYQTELRGREANIEVLRKAIQETQSQIDPATAKQDADATELARLQALLADYREATTRLQQEQTSLQQLLREATNSVTILESPRTQAAGATGPYTATLTLLVGQEATNAETGSSDAAPAERLAATYARMIGERSVLEAAVSKLGLDQSIDALQAAVSAEHIPNTQLVQLRVTGSDAGRAALMAGAIAQAFIEQTNEIAARPYSGRLGNIEAEIASLAALIERTRADIETQSAASRQSAAELTRLQDLLAEYRGDARSLEQDYERVRLSANRAPSTAVIAERASEPRVPAENDLLYILLAAVVGGLVGLGAAFLIEYLEESIRTSEDVSHVLGLTTLGTIELFDDEDGKPVTAARPSSSTAEAFRMLATNVRLASPDDRPRTILVTSPAPEDGKSLVAANLAAALASAGLRVVIVDADLRRPRQHLVFGLTQGLGLTYALCEGNVIDHLRSSGLERVMILTSGTVPQDPVAALSSPRMSKLFEDLLKQADLVIIDTPPVLAVADAKLLAAEADAAVLVLRVGHTSSQLARHAVEALRQTKTRLLGVVLNGVPSHAGNYYGFYGTRDETTRVAPGQKKGARLPGVRLPGVRLFPWRLPIRNGEHDRQRPAGRAGNAGPT